MKWLLFFLGLTPALATAQHEADLMYRLNESLLLSARYPQPNGHRNYLSQLNTAISSGKNVADNTYAKGLYYLGQCDVAQMVFWLEAACQLDPKHHGYVGWVYLTYLRDYPRALAHYDAYDALTPGDEDREGDHPVYYLRAEIFRFMGRPAEALPGYDRAIAQVEDKHGPTWVNHRYYLARAQARLAVGRPADALSDLDKGIPNNPGSPALNFWRGKALQALNRHAEARMAYTDALLWLRNSTVEQDEYYERQDAVYEQQINAALATLPN